MAGFCMTLSNVTQFNLDEKKRILVRISIFTHVIKRKENGTIHGLLHQKKPFYPSSQNEMKIN